MKTCTCHCGGAMFYRHLHDPSCPLSTTGEEAPVSKETELIREAREIAEHMIELEETVSADWESSPYECPIYVLAQAFIEKTKESA